MTPPPLAAGECHVWWARTTSALADLDSVLDPVERQRAAAYRQEQDRRRFVVGCAVSRLVLATQLDVPADRVPLDRHCRRCGAPHGPPRLLGGDIAFSVSHSGDRVVVAFVRNASVGVDVETERRSFQVEELLDSVLAPVERAHLFDFPGLDLTRAFLSYWVRKEAVVKATTEGLAVDLAGVVVSPPDRRPKLLAYEGDAAIAESTAMASLHPDAGYIAALAVVGGTLGTVSEYNAETLLCAASG